MKAYPYHVLDYGHPDRELPMTWEERQLEAAMQKQAELESRFRKHKRKKRNKPREAIKTHAKMSDYTREDLECDYSSWRR